MLFIVSVEWKRLKYGNFCVLVTDMTLTSLTVPVNKLVVVFIQVFILVGME